MEGDIDAFGKYEGHLGGPSVLESATAAESLGEDTDGDQQDEDTGTQPEVEVSFRREPAIGLQFFDALRIGLPQLIFFDDKERFILIFYFTVCLPNEVGVCPGNLNFDGL